MEKDFLEKLNKAKKEVNLTEERKAVLKSEIVRSIDLARQLGQISSRSIINSLILKTMPILAYVLILAVVGGGVSTAAEGALPGDALYTIKVKVNEEVRAALTASTEAKAEWEARRAERRLEEAAELEAKGELKEGAKAELEEKFEEHAQRVAERLVKLEAKGKAEVAAKVAERFERSLEAHQDVLAKVGVTLDKVAEIKLDLQLKAAAQVEAAAEKEDEREDGGPAVRAATEGKIGAASNVINSVRKFIERKKAELGVGAVVEAEAKLKKADELLVEAETKLQASVYAEAFDLAQESIRASQEAKAAVELKKEKEEIELDGPEMLEVKTKVPGIKVRIKVE